jgi:hypothetical protein
LSQVLTVTAAAGRLVATVDVDNACTLWLSADGGEAWRTVPLPVPSRTAADHALAVAGRGDTVLLAADDGTRGTLWAGSL